MSGLFGLPPLKLVFVASVAVGLLVARHSPNTESAVSTHISAALCATLPLLSLLWSFIISPTFFNPLRHIPPLKSGWRNRLYTWIYSEPSPPQVLEWVKNTPNARSNGVLRYTAIGGETRVLLTNADAVKDAFVTQQYDSFEKPEKIRVRTGTFVGFGLSSTAGDVHKAQKRKLSPALSTQATRAMAPLFWERASALVEKISESLDPSDDAAQASRIIDIPRWASRVTVDVIGVAVLGKKYDTISDPDTSFYKDYTNLSDISMSDTIIPKVALFIPIRLLSKLPLEFNYKIRCALLASRKACVEAVKEHREYHTLEGRKDVISIAMQSGLFDDEELINHVGNLLGAGHETTAFQISFVCQFLHQNPDVQERLRREIRTNLPSPVSDEEVDAQALEGLPYLNAVVRESIRLMPSATGMYRMAIKDTTVQNYFIPAGTTVAAFAGVNHRLESNWGADAEVFNPERWLVSGQELLGGSKSRNDFISFSAGPRNCPGATFAQQEILAVVAALVGRFRIVSVGPESDPPVRYNVSAAPAKGLLIKVIRVEGW